MSVLVKQPGLLSLLHDRGRYGQAALGLTTGGPADPLAASLANRLLGNSEAATTLEVSFGGLRVDVLRDVQVAITGADLSVRVDGESREMWRGLALSAGSTLELGFSEIGCRTYVAVSGGVDVPRAFGSTSTVVREGIGGLGGRKLEAGDKLPVIGGTAAELRWIPPSQRPRYHRRAILRVIPGYQTKEFSSLDRTRFFSSRYQVPDRCDRMGYRLDGPAIACERGGMLSEGIALGSVQVPADGQPIVLLHARQTIGGYPKLGVVLASDCAALAQLRPGDSVHFTPMTPQEAHNAVNLAHVFEKSRRFEAAPQ